ncbi:hypothetical protein HMN09_00963300 [Mycena chlorophos]|uniref:Uncharacterized protein n=1 Tax=Mycena chlorophos TaxID=658473 RepID=A0A8H6SIV1_MYCCL|nr:hypothetical protein HMN09_00963300 [Mycena chlorophos]
MTPLRPIEVHFEGIEREPFVAEMCRVPGSDRPFTTALPHPPPPETLKLSVASDAFFVNNYSDNHRIALPISDARLWGTCSGGELRIFYARATATTTEGETMRFCLRFIFDAENNTRKISPNYVFLEDLIADAQFHFKHLRAAAGTIVPAHYGPWKMDTGKWAGVVVFSLTQWCGTPWATICNTKYNTLANRLLVGRTFEQLHDLGIQLTRSMGCTDNYCQVLLDIEHPSATPERCFDGRARCYVVSFSNASVHNCQRKLPVLPIARSLFNDPLFGCDELSNVSALMGFMEASFTPETAADEALRWHKEYTTRHPTHRNSAVLIAQRASLFPNAIPLYPGLDVTGPSREDTSVEVSLSNVDGTTLDPAQGFESCTMRQLALGLWGRYLHLRPRPDGTNSTGSPVHG